LAKVVFPEQKEGRNVRYTLTMTVTLSAPEERRFGYMDGMIALQCLRAEAALREALEWSRGFAKIEHVESDATFDVERKAA
jgi:hypothetical protein